MAFGENPSRERNFSLEIHKIQPSAVFGVRRENDLSGTGYAWTPVLFLLLSALRMFRLFGAVRGRLIGPKTWDRIYKIFGRKNGAAVAAPRLILG